MKSTPIKYIIGLILAIFSLAIFHNQHITEVINVKLNVSTSKNLNLQIFWANNNESFRELKSLKKSVIPGKQTINFQVPANKLKRFRLDFGEFPENVTVHNLCIEGRDSDVILNSAALFTAHNIQSINNSKEGLIIRSTHREPYIIAKEKLNIQSKSYSIQWFNFALIGFVPFYLCCVIWDMFANKKPTLPPRDKSVTHVSGAPVPQALPPHTRRKLHNLDFLRILFTLGVLDLHFSKGLFKLHSTGGQGVEFFFILSGFLLMLTYRPERQLLEYAQQRYIRFVPLVILGGILAGGEWESFLGVFMLQNTGMAYGDVPNAPSWYIAILFWCSLFYLGLIKTLSYRRMLMLVACLTFLTLIFVANIKGGDRQPMMECLPLNRGLLRGLSCMGLGILLAHICKPGSFSHAIKPSIAAIFSLAEIGILAYIIVSCFNQSYASSYWIFQPLCHVGLIGLFIVQAGLISRLTNKPIFSLLSNYCLSIYLTHWFCQITVWKWVTYYYPTWIPENVELSLAIAFAISCLVGVLAHHLVEKPCTRYLTQFIKWLKDGISVQTENS